MKKTILSFLLLAGTLLAKETFVLHENKRITAHIVDLKKDKLEFFLKDNNGTIFK